MLMLLKPRGLQAGQALQFVHAFVVADLAKEIGEGREPSVVLREHALEGLCLKTGILGHEFHVFVLGVILEVGVQEIAPAGPDHIEEPGDMVIKKSDRLGDEPVLEKVFADFLFVLKLLQGQQMPLFVVLLEPALSNPVEDTAGEIGLRMRMGDRDVGDVLPGLVRHPGDNFQYLEFGKALAAPVEEVRCDEEQAGKQAVAHAGRCESFFLFPLELLRGQAFHRQADYTPMRICTRVE